MIWNCLAIFIFEFLLDSKSQDQIGLIEFRFNVTFANIGNGWGQTQQAMIAVAKYIIIIRTTISAMHISHGGWVV